MGWSPGPVVGAGGVRLAGISSMSREELEGEKIFGIEAWALPSRKKTNVVVSRTEASIRHTILVGVLRRILRDIRSQLSLNCDPKSILEKQGVCSNISRVSELLL